MQLQHRQGDVFMVRVGDTLPKGAKKMKPDKGRTSAEGLKPFPTDTSYRSPFTPTFQARAVGRFPRCVPRFLNPKRKTGRCWPKRAEIFQPSHAEHFPVESTPYRFNTIRRAS